MVHLPVASGHAAAAAMPGRIMLMAMPEELYQNATYNTAVPL